MKQEDLQKKHPTYNRMVKYWDFWGLAYAGGEPFIEQVLYRHLRETRANWQLRIQEGMNFNYCATIIDLFNFYLTEKPPIRNMAGLSEDQSWKYFTKDADLKGTDFSTLLNEMQKLASVCGAMGILVNKPGDTSVQNRKEELDKRIYPYCSLYTLQNIYDWKFERNKETHRHELVYLKLKESSELSNDIFTLWYPDHWERWEIVNNRDKSDAVQVASGVNDLGEIPFVWSENIKDITRPLIGVSDIVEASRLMASIVRNLSAGEEVIKFAGFPMMRKPMDPDDEDDNDDISAGPTAVQEFNPEFGEAGKPDWMEPKIHRSISAISEWIKLKTNEIFRTSHLSGIHGQKTSNMMSTGISLRYEFQQLQSVLSKKADNLTETELSIMRLWCKWQNMEDIMDSITVTRAKNFSVDDLSISLANAFEAINNIPSKIFIKKMSTHVTKQLLPDLPDSTFDEIEKELEGTVQIFQDEYAYNRFTYKAENRKEDGFVSNLKGATNPIVEAGVKSDADPNKEPIKTPYKKKPKFKNVDSPSQAVKKKVA